MEFEVHVTVKSKNIEQFKEDCSTINVKPIVINMENVNEQQVMTSSKHRSDNYIVICDNIKQQLINKGYSIERIKVEKNPDLTKDNQHIYFESHLRVNFEDNIQNKNLLSEILKKHKVHLSRNMFKKEKDKCFFMCTLRNKNTNIVSFRNDIDNVKNEILLHNVFNIDKIEVEECIFDSNESLDNNWLNN
jgi:hypothetical protein